MQSLKDHRTDNLIIEILKCYEGHALTRTCIQYDTNVNIHVKFLKSYNTMRHIFLYTSNQNNRQNKETIKDIYKY